MFLTIAQMFEYFVHIHLCHDLCMITDVRVQKVRKRVSLTNSISEYSKEKEKGGGDGMNLIMGYNLVKPK